MEHYATILNGPETLAADIMKRAPAQGFDDRFIVYYVDEETRRDANVEAIVGKYYTSDIDDAIRHANAWVTQTPVEDVPECDEGCQATHALADWDAE